MTLFTTETTIYADIVADTIPHAKVAVLYQNDDYGREYLRSFKTQLAKRDSVAEIVAASAYEVTSPTIESQIIALAATNANVFLNASTGKFTSQAIRKAGEIGWHAQQFLPIGRNFISIILRPAGLDYGRNLGNADQVGRRPRMEQRSRLSRMARLHEEILSRRRSRGRIS